VVAGQALERDPMSGELHMRLGYAYLRLVEYEKALFHARRLVALEPGNPNGPGIESAIHQRAGRYAEAIKAIRISQELDPTDYELPVDEALSLLALGELDEAEARIQKARKMSPDGFLPLVAEATLYYRRGDLDRAVQTLQTVFDQGIEPRRWGGFLTTHIVRDHALNSNRFDLMLDQFGPWSQVDLLDSQINTGRDYFFKVPMVPALRAAGRDEIADAIVQSARAFRDDDDDPGLTLAIATGDVDTLVAALTSDMAEGLRPIAWIQLESPAMAFARDDPRFKNLISQYQAQIENQKIAYALLQEETD
jgi:tetratricopeptide (TPR) repeat protein